MIRKPQWVADRLTELAHDILNDKLTIIDGAADLAGKIQIDDKPLALEVLEDKTRAWIKQAMHSIVRAVTKIVEDEESSGQAALMPLPFPWLPAYLEIAPGRTVHQRVMTRSDWTATRAIWLNRQIQADLGYKGIERAFDLVMPLLTDDDLTTGDVADQLQADYDDGEGNAQQA